MELLWLKFCHSCQGSSSSTNSAAKCNSKCANRAGHAAPSTIECVKEVADGSLKLTYHRLRASKQNIEWNRLAGAHTIELNVNIKRL